MRRQLRVPISVKMASFQREKVPQCYRDPEGKGLLSPFSGGNEVETAAPLLTHHCAGGRLWGHLPDGVGDAPPVPHAVPDHPGGY
jgi:hypothetical protein